MSDELCERIEKAAKNAQKELGLMDTKQDSQKHNEYSHEFARQLNIERVSFMRQKPLLLEHLIPDFTIFENGATVCHIEVKSKRDLTKEDLDQAKSYKEASKHEFVYLINFGKNDGPNIKKL